MQNIEIDSQTVQTAQTAPLQLAPAALPHKISKPFVKSAGGKRQLLPKLVPMVPETFGTYYEPMMGGAALFHSLWSAGRLDGPKRVVLGDSNPMLCELFTAVRDAGRAVIPLLEAHARVHGKDHYLEVRDRLGRGNLAERAADYLYLNRTCYCGLMRFSKREGRFNTPMGRYENPGICDAPRLQAAAEALRDVEIIEGDFAAICEGAAAGDFVYFDPPYLPLSKTSDFTAYTKDDFTLEDHKRLCALAANLKSRGVSVLLSQSSAPAIREMYSSGATRFEITEVSAKRIINSKVAGRGNVVELLIR
jgi:DNA adenine methylase